MYRTLWARTGRLRGDVFGLPLTEREEDALVAVVNAGGETAALATGEWPGVTLKKRLESVRAKLGAKNTTHAAAIAYPDLKDRYQVRP